MLNYLPIVPKASIYVPKVIHKPVMGGNTVSETFTHTHTWFLFQSVSFATFEAGCGCGFTPLACVSAS